VAWTDDYPRALSAAVDDLNDRYSLVFDDESAHGEAALLAAAHLALVFKDSAEERAYWTSDRQVAEIDQTIAALERYRETVRAGIANDDER
jgi:hypothetical protein